MQAPARALPLSQDSCGAGSEKVGFSHVPPCSLELSDFFFSHHLQKNHTFLGSQRSENLFPSFFELLQMGSGH